VVEFEAVSFAYEDAPVLSEVSFRVEAGETVALVGPSGAGKSTTLDLIARFYDPLAGVVRVDGHDLRDLDVDAYRSQLAVVSQSPFLFNTSIERNIRHGRPGASFDEVGAAAKAANIHDFILELPEGYQTEVGERGAKLSGGQLQRLTIARACLKNASILLLDEATSSLDSHSEEQVQRALENLMQGRTSFVIAHRLSTIRNADRILVMEQGRIVQVGTHLELLAEPGLYHQLHQLQKLAVG
jgi:ABC-type multidrug transport system fused ATPase/permease subunit